jgi:hypothetical protein
MYTYTKFDSGVRDRYLLGGGEDIFLGGADEKPLRGVKKTEPLGGTKIIVLLVRKKITFYNDC